MKNNAQALSILAFAAARTQASLMPRQGTAGITTRYWDCCKASCSWPGKAAFSAPVNVCDINDNPLSPAAQPRSGCDNDPEGTAYTCSNQQPFAINDNLAYGFAAVTGNAREDDTCCACYKLTFQNQINNKVMVVQSTNIGFDVKDVQFDIALPGGGVGAFPQGCERQYNAPAGLGWGSNPRRPYGGVESREECDQLPARLQPGCQFRFDWMQGADNPTIIYERVSCPNELVARTNCRRNDDGNFPAPPTGSPSDAPTTPPPPENAPTDPPAAGTSPLYGQCGGEDWNGPTTCESGSTCQRQDQYYSQCLPAGSDPPSSSQPHPDNGGGGGSGTSPKFGQCGGQGWNGPTTCEVGSTCQSQNEFYSQCL